MPRLVYIVTSSLTANALLRGQLAYMASQGFEVTVIASPSEELSRVGDREGVRTIGVRMSREIDPLADTTSLWSLTRTLRRLRPDIVHASTPKAGLLGMLAARAARVPTRIYLIRGLRLETTTGPRRRLLAATERIAIACAHQVYCVSDSLRNRIEHLGLAPTGRVTVIAAGSSNGVDPARFCPGDAADRNAARADLGLDPTRPVVGFVGRLTRDKGIGDLLEAIRAVRAQLGKVQLLLVGGYEQGDAVTDDAATALAADPDTVVTGHVADTAKTYRAMDVLAFPSYREGFPNVPLEAAANELPVVAYAATGTVDAVVDRVTGALVPVGDAAQLAARLIEYLADRELRRRHGRAGRQRAITEFTPERVWAATANALRAAHHRR